MSLLPFLHRAAAHQDLSAAQAQEAMAIVLGGGASTAQIAAFLVALRMKGETSAELLGFARAMREAARDGLAATARSRRAPPGASLQTLVIASLSAMGSNNRLDAQCCRKVQNGYVNIFVLPFKRLSSQVREESRSGFSWRKRASPCSVMGH